MQLFYWKIVRYKKKVSCKLEFLNCWWDYYTLQEQTDFSSVQYKAVSVHCRISYRPAEYCGENIAFSENFATNGNKFEYNDAKDSL